jgi:hypothetical protein
MLNVSEKLESIAISYPNFATFKLKERKTLQVLLAITNNQNHSQL